MRLISILLLLVSSVIGCGQGFRPESSAPLIGQVNDALTCPNQRSKVFDAYYKAYQEDDDFSVEDFSGGMTANFRIRAKKFVTLSIQAQSQYTRSVQTIHHIMTDEVRSLTRASQVSRLAKQNQISGVAEDVVPEGEQDPILHLARLEMRSQIEPQYDELNRKLDGALANVSLVVSEAAARCEAQEPDSGSVPGPVPAPAPGPEPVPENPGIEAPPPNPGPEPDPVIEPPPIDTTDPVTNSVNSPLYGALRTMATAYQSCSVLNLPPVTKNVETVRGVVRGGAIDQYGYGREYTDVAQLKRTHYYHRGQTYGPDCADQDAKPLVYDYGGEPVVKGATLNLFKNSGGGSALGIDCSAFVATSVALAGNLYQKSSENKPYYSRFTSRDFIDPVKSKWNCYGTIKVDSTDTIKSGDIAAVQGHVVMIDQAGSDPFGLAKVVRSSDCSRLSFADFDFSVIQSSPEKNSLGINRFVVKDYLTDGGKMATMFLGYAKKACLSKFDGVLRNPATAAYGIIRHKQTASCLAPKITLAKETCIDRCPAL